MKVQKFMCQNFIRSIKSKKKVSVLHYSIDRYVYVSSKPLKEHALYVFGCTFRLFL